MPGRVRQSSEEESLLQGKSVEGFAVVGGVGLGRVYRVRRGAQTYAMKVGRPVEAAPDRPSGLECAWRRLQSVNHPNAARIVEVGCFEASDGYRPFLVMEFVEGAPLLWWVRSANLHSSELARAFAKVAQGLERLHGVGACHGNLESETVLVRCGDSEPVLVGYGLEPADERPASRLSPERCAWLLERPEGPLPDSPTYSPAEDHYALGVLLYEALTGRRPCLAKQRDALREDVLRRIRDERAAAIRSGVPLPLAAIVQGLLAKDPRSRRPASEALGRLGPGQAP
ncbi:MAG TPA: protein kinase [Myxococcales bacterium]|jgi:serine/threonine protein kinase